MTDHEWPSGRSLFDRYLPMQVSPRQSGSYSPTFATRFIHRTEPSSGLPGATSPNRVGHNYIGHNYIGLLGATSPNPVGHNYIGHHYIGLLGAISPDPVLPRKNHYAEMASL